VDYFTRVCEGNEKVGNEMMNEIDAVAAEMRELNADADTDNDPDRETWMKSLEQRMNKNKIIYHWLGGRSAASLVQAMYGEPEEGRQKGQMADFIANGNYTGTGSGFFIAADGWVITNAHVVGDSTDVDVRTADGVIRKATVQRVDEALDLALLKTAPSSAWLKVSSSDADMAADVCTVGFPNANVQGVEPKYTAGTVSSLSGVRDDPNEYQTTVPVQPGNSGGPLVDMKSGAVVGVVCSILRADEAENVSYAIKVSKLNAFLSAVPEASTAAAAPASAPTGGDATAVAAKVRAGIVMVLVK
jgi:serine protease Do